MSISPWKKLKPRSAPESLVTDRVFTRHAGANDNTLGSILELDIDAQLVNFANSAAITIREEKLDAYHAGSKKSSDPTL